MATKKRQLCEVVRRVPEWTAKTAKGIRKNKSTNRRWTDSNWAAESWKENLKNHKSLQKKSSPKAPDRLPGNPASVAWKERKLLCQVVQVQWWGSFGLQLSHSQLSRRVRALKFENLNRSVDWMMVQWRLRKGPQVASIISNKISSELLNKNYSSTSLTMKWMRWRMMSDEVRWNCVCRSWWIGNVTVIWDLYKK